MSQLERADFCGSNRSIERRLYRLQRQRRKLPGITGSQGNWYNSIQATECNLLVPDSPVTKFCPSKLMSAIYCIAWSFFLLQQTKTCNSQKYNELNRASRIDHKPPCLRFPIQLQVIYYHWLYAARSQFPLLKCSKCLRAV